MTAQTAVDRVVDLLSTAGYRRMTTPIEIGSLTFDFPAALVGTDRLPDLILVAETTPENERRVQRKIEGVARAMDVVGSKRPLTVVFVGPRPRTSSLGAVSRVCRVLPLGIVSEDYSDTKLRNWLAVLLPLTLPVADGGVADPLSEVQDRLVGLPADIVEMLTIARKGSSAVQRYMTNLIAAPLEEKN